MNHLNFDSSSSSDDGDGNQGVFTPGRGRRKSLVQDFTPTPSRSATTDGSTPNPKFKTTNHSRMQSDVEDNPNASVFTDPTPNTLPKLQNTSWLGAGMSPIRKGSQSNRIGNGEVYDNEHATAPFRLGIAVAPPDLSPAAASESFFLGVNDDTDDMEESNGGKQASKASTNPARGMATTKKSIQGHIRPRPHLLFHPSTAATITTNTSGGLGATREANEPSSRRRLLSRNFWSLWPASSPPSETDPSSSYALIDAPSRRIAANASSLAIQIRKGNLWVIGSTALILFCVGVHDAFLAYLALRSGITAEGHDDGLAWTFPWIGPTRASLLRFGSFCPERLLSASSQYWRSFTSLVVPISLVEWLLLVWVWTRYLPVSLLSSASNYSWQLSWPFVYLLSAWTGQLWMVVFCYERVLTSLAARGENNNNYEYESSYLLPALSGCAGWGTAGVLCAVGIQLPNRRFPCFLSSIALVVLHEFQATGSVIGCAAASFFGWAFSGMWSLTPEILISRKRWHQWQREMLFNDYSYRDIFQDDGGATDEKRRWTLWHVMAALVVGLLWGFPVLYFLYR